MEGRFGAFRTLLGGLTILIKGWFKGMSEKFLSLKLGKLLVLAGTDRLDKTLTIAQMQGLFCLMQENSRWRL